MQVRALAQRRITIDSLDQPLGNDFGIQAKEPGELSHAITMRQTDDDGAPIGWHSHK